MWRGVDSTQEQTKRPEKHRDALLGAFYQKAVAIIPTIAMQTPKP